MTNFGRKVMMFVTAVYLVNVLFLMSLFYNTFSLSISVLDKLIILVCAWSTCCVLVYYVGSNLRTIFGEKQCTKDGLAKKD
jgi:predicted membrane protein